MLIADDVANTIWRVQYKRMVDAKKQATAKLHFAASGGGLGGHNWLKIARPRSPALACFSPTLPV